MKSNSFRGKVLGINRVTFNLHLFNVEDFIEDHLDIVRYI